MDKQAVSEALQDAIMDYNSWASRQKNLSYTKEKYAEFRGIFYNKLSTKLKCDRQFFRANKDLYGRLLEPDDLEPYFNGGIMIRLSINLWAKNHHSGTKRKFLDMLIEATGEIVYDLIEDRH